MKLHCKFSIWNAVTLHDTFILTNKKIYLGWGKKVNVHLTTIERGIEIFSTFFLRKLIRSCNIFARGGSFFITKFFLMNIWMRKLFLLCQSRVILRLMSSWMNFCVCFFFHYFEHILFLIICICSYVDSKNVHFPLEVMLQCQSAIFPL